MVKNINIEEARTMFKSHHYLRSSPFLSIAHGLYDDDILIGAIGYSTSVAQHAGNLFYNQESDEQSIQLARMFIKERPKENLASWFISQSIKLLRSQRQDVVAIFSYADPTFHKGTVYLATNWIFVGISGKSHSLKIGDETYHTRTVYDKYGTSDLNKLKRMLQRDDIIPIPQQRKIKFVYILSRGKKRKNLMNRLRSTSMPLRLDL